MTNLENAAMLRRWAMQCAAQADDPHASGDERARLLKMRTALLELAQTQDWLDGERNRLTSQPAMARVRDNRATARNGAAERR